MLRKQKYDHYRLLGVDNWATTEEIKHAYRRKVKFCHPDTNTSPKAAEAFRAVHAAYSVLIDPVERVHYDEQLKFHRPTEKQTTHYAPRSRKCAERATRPTGSTEEKRTHVTPFMFYTMHVVGLLFGLAVVSRTVVGFTLEDWPFYMAIFLIPGLAILPDSLSGLRSMS